MKLTIGNNNFTDIGTAVFYTQQDLDNRAYSKVQYKSNSSLLYYRDFSEYGFSYDIEKDKFNDEFKVDYLGNKTLELFDEQGKPSSDILEKLESTIFPTLGEEEWVSSEDKEKYFGTTLINNQVFCLLYAEEEVKRIELYNGIITRNNTQGYFGDFVCSDDLPDPSEIPYFVITLGEPGISEEYDPSIDLVRKRELEEEVTYEKMVWILITSNNEVSEVNLSYRSWIDSINPNRNMNRYVLRNDEFYGTKDSMGIIESTSDAEFVKIDANSGTLFSTEDVPSEKLLAFRQIKDRVEQNKYLEDPEKQDYPLYFPYTTYREGDCVYYGDSVWESVSDNNFNCNPLLSSKWIKKETLDNTRSIKVIVKVIPEGAGYCEPMGILSIPSLDSKINFKIFPGPGYELNTINPCLTDDIGYKVLGNENFDYVLPDDTIIMWNWKDVITTNKLVVNLRSVGGTIKLVAEQGGQEIEYSQWISVFNDSNFDVYRMISGEGDNKVVVDNPYINQEGELSVTIGKRLELYFREFTSQEISSVEVTYKESVNSEPLTTIVTPVDLDNRESAIIIPEVNFTEAIFKFILGQKYVTASIIEFSGFEISNYSIRTIAGTPVIFKFIENEFTSDGNRKDLLDSVILEDSQGNVLTIGRFTSSTNLSLGLSTVEFSRVNQPIGSVNYGEYTLKINNIYYDTRIKILRKQ